MTRPRRRLPACLRTLCGALTATVPLSAFAADPCNDTVRCAMSWSQSRIAQHNDIDVFRYGPMDGYNDGPFTTLKHFPLWVTIPDHAYDDDPDKYRLLQIETRLAWLTDNLLLVNQRNLDTGETLCPILDTGTGEWTEQDGLCIQPRGFRLNLLDAGPHGLISAYSSSEGARSVQLYRWTPGAGLSELPLPNFNLYGGHLDLHFTRDPQKVLLTTPCDLNAKLSDDHPHLCEPLFDYEKPIRTYEWIVDKSAPPRLTSD